MTSVEWPLGWHQACHCEQLFKLLSPRGVGSGATLLHPAAGQSQVVPPKEQAGRRADLGHERRPQRRELPSEGFQQNSVLEVCYFIQRLEAALESNLEE